MKKIYMFTLSNFDGDEHTKSDLRLLAYLMYEDLADYEIDHKVLAKNKNITENALIETKINNEFRYRFTYDDGDLSNCFVSPLMIGEDSFAITIYNGSLSEFDISFLLQNNLRMLNSEYNVTYTSVSYEAKDEMDESNRLEAIRQLTGIVVNKDSTKSNSKFKTKSRIKSGFSSSILGLSWR